MPALFYDSHRLKHYKVLARLWRFGRERFYSIDGIPDSISTSCLFICFTMCRHFAPACLVFHTLGLTGIWQIFYRGSCFFARNVTYLYSFQSDIYFRKLFRILTLTNGYPGTQLIQGRFYVRVTLYDYEIPALICDNYATINQRTTTHAAVFPPAGSF